ncbi:hypothetical protein A3A93_01205 [Candidatus Roizmanbacteria bacterium RIFCSPLOWO2_01_FULL_38_12]|uniref:DAHP synthetase I/KDSA domain-containing protein n=1 Tax=Candidatus Roizmanbacteria bacterium RIFCSPLOWO2_01_FULL_38_12 TaxID=1802061 RepID=A0A1F7IR42_9BACT|nr:MAG: hypothetical protein A3F59_03020 [Candidatus Roizmanbacteria bacterium RIFCSPHIGHO2_12_FULL_38_13]OGK45816.1 MAG: hypothetical protein A3A93_01205 [Candidatus Roizmanbacteria bacterium RIFCSPLOWO2_01_FULL_38_12]
MKNQKITIIAGPCSIDDNNINEIMEIAKITIRNRSGKKQKAVAGTRVVGLKSRTELDMSGKGMGMDFEVYKKNMEILLKGGTLSDFKVLPSAYIAEKLVEKTGLMIATEVMNPIIQLPSYEKRIPHRKLLPWNPAVNQLGWQIEQTVAFAKRNGWHIGIKNGKWIGDHIHTSNTDEYLGKTTMEKTWAGLVKYATGIDGDVILIHRGVDVPGKENFRNAPVHAIAKRVKKDTKVKLFFDPSHTYGPKLRDHIVDAVIEAMKMKIEKNEFLYDGVLIETGTSSTDTDQHITIAELQLLVAKLAKFRDLVAP